MDFFKVDSKGLVTGKSDLCISIHSRKGTNKMEAQLVGALWVNPQQLNYTYNEHRKQLNLCILSKKDLLLQELRLLSP